VQGSHAGGRLETGVGGPGVVPRGKSRDGPGASAQGASGDGRRGSGGRPPGEVARRPRCVSTGAVWRRASGRRDSNPRSLDPQSSALNQARPRPGASRNPASGHTLAHPCHRSETTSRPLVLRRHFAVPPRNRMPRGCVLTSRRDARGVADRGWEGRAWPHPSTDRATMSTGAAAVNTATISTPVGKTTMGGGSGTPRQTGRRRFRCPLSATKATKATKEIKATHSAPTTSWPPGRAQAARPGRPGLAAGAAASSTAPS
jgi:hypothetical protein